MIDTLSPIDPALLTDARTVLDHAESNTKTPTNGAADQLAQLRVQLAQFRDSFDQDNEQLIWLLPITSAPESTELRESGIIIEQTKVLWTPSEIDPDPTAWRTVQLASVKVRRDSKATKDEVNEILDSGAVIDTTKLPITRIDVQLGQDRARKLPNADKPEGGTIHTIAGPRILFQLRPGHNPVSRVNVGGARHEPYGIEIQPIPIIKTARSIRGKAAKAVAA